MVNAYNIYMNSLEKMTVAKTRAKTGLLTAVWLIVGYNERRSVRRSSVMKLSLTLTFETPLEKILFI
jgi:hypothetical protein